MFKENEDEDKNYLKNSIFSKLLYNNTHPNRPYLVTIIFLNSLPRSIEHVGKILSSYNI